MAEPTAEAGNQDAIGSLTGDLLGLDPAEFEPEAANEEDAIAAAILGETADEPDDEEEVTEEPDADDEPDPEPEAEAEPEKPAMWDFERQKRDQERAAEKKRYEAQIADLQAKLDAGRTGADEDADEETGDLLAGIEDELPEELVKDLRARDRRTKALESEIAAMKAEREAERRAMQEAADSDSWQKFEQGIVKQYGADVWNAAVKSATGYFHAKGYSAESPPDAEAAMARIELAARDAASTKAAPKSKPKPKPAVEPDKGTVTKTAPKKRFGSDEEILADLRKRGLVT